MRRRSVAFAVAVACALGAAAFGQTKAGEKRVMTIFNFSEYIDPEVYRQFERLHGCTVKEITFETPEEALNKMVAGGSRTFDVCAVGGNFMMPSAIAQRVIRPLDHAKIPNLKNLAPEYRNPHYDPNNQHSIPYQWGTTGIFIRKDLLPEGGFSLKSIFEGQKQLGRFVLIDSVREMLGYANLYQGAALNDVQIEVLKKSVGLIARTKNSKNCMGFDGGIGGRSKVVAGTADYAIIYSGDAIRVLDQYAGKFAYVIPNEGGVLWVDQLCIARDAPNPDLAYAFLNYVLDAQIGAQISHWTKYPTPNAAAKALIKKEDLANPVIYPTPEQMKKLHYVEYLADKETLRNDAWVAIKAN
jgi:spermidine/putrescine transport system substrate-binding protein